MQAVLRRMFGQPEGLLGRVGGVVMARMNAACGAWVVGLLDIDRFDRVLEVGFGPGAIIRILSQRASRGYVVGVDLSREMVRQAERRNAAAIRSGRVALQQGTVDNLPFADASFDKVLSINSLQLWGDVFTGLKEIRRVMRPGGRLALGFTPQARQASKGLAETVVAAGFARPKLLHRDGSFCVLATRP